MIVGTALVLASAIPTAAQTVGAGVSFLGDQGGTGVQLDYASPFRTLSGNRRLDLVGDLSLHHNSIGGDLSGITVGVTSFFLQVGGRVTGALDQRFGWFGQALIGIHHVSVGSAATGDVKTACDALNIDCSASAGDTGLVVTPGGAVTYALNERTSLRGQLDIPIRGSGTTTRLFFGVSFQVGR